MEINMYFQDNLTKFSKAISLANQEEALPQKNLSQKLFSSMECQRKY